MTVSAPICYIDSGIGGYPYLAWVRARRRREDLLYVADRANYPYGPKSPEVLRAVTRQLVGEVLRRYRPKLFVIACNTASVTALADLRRGFPGVPFVGVVPALKPAATRFTDRAIMLLATEQTARDPYVDDLIDTFAPRREVFRVPVPGLVDLVERTGGAVDDTDVRRLLLDAISKIDERSPDSRFATAVLGCTHFLHARDSIRRALPSSIELVDSLDGVGRQTLRILDRMGTPSRRNGRVRFVTTGTRESAAGAARLNPPPESVSTLLVNR